MARVTIRPSGRVFACEGKQTILEAALAASIPLNYGCSQGTCGLCLARLLRGEIEKIKHHDFVIKEAQKSNGDFLLCANSAATPEVLVEATEALSNGDIPLQEINARIKKLACVGDTAGVISVQTPRSARLRFLAGQNVRLTLRDGTFSDLPIASCPCDDRNLEFHLNRVCSEPFSQAVFAASLPVPVQIEGPWGGIEQSFGGRHTICLAEESHISAIKGWIEQQLAEEHARTIELHWFSLTRDRFYLRNILAAWDDAFEAFSCHTIAIGEESRTDEVVAERLARIVTANADEIKVLAAGSPGFLACIKRTLQQFELADSLLLIEGTAPGPVGARP